MVILIFILTLILTIILITILIIILILVLRLLVAMEVVGIVCLEVVLEVTVLCLFLFLIGFFRLEELCVLSPSVVVTTSISPGGGVVVYVWHDPCDYLI